MEFILIKRDTRNNEIEEGTKVFTDEWEALNAVNEIQRITNKSGFPFVYWYEKH